MIAETEMHYVSPQAAGFVAVFLVFYLTLLVRRAIANKLEIYDFLLLSSVAIVPFVFVFMPKTILKITHLLGVGLPVVFLFSALIFILFLLLYTVIRRLTLLRRQFSVVVQEIALLRQRVEIETPPRLHDGE
jgi:hypothetical protein